MDEVTSGLAALLEMYSDIGLGHASFMIACFIGLFSILGLMNSFSGDAFCILIIAYWGVWFVGMYCLFKFFWNIEYAEAIKRKILENHGEVESEIKKIHQDFWNKGWFKSRFYNYLEHGLFGEKHTSDAIFLGYILLGVLPFISILTMKNYITFPRYLPYQLVILGLICDFLGTLLFGVPVIEFKFIESHPAVRSPPSRWRKYISYIGLAFLLIGFILQAAGTLLASG